MSKDKRIIEQLDGETFVILDQDKFDLWKQNGGELYISGWGYIYMELSTLDSYGIIELLGYDE